MNARERYCLEYHNAWCDCKGEELPSVEKRITNELTGGEKGGKPERFDLLPWDIITEDARLYGVGAKKYDERNWEKGYLVSLSYAALLRHLSQWWMGEDVDKETGISHLASVRFHAAAMMRFTNGYYPVELDNRPIPKEEDKFIDFPG